MTSAGFTDVHVVEGTQPAIIAAAEFDDPDRLFTFNSQWQLLSAKDRSRVVSVIRSRQTTTGTSAVPSTALSQPPDAPERKRNGQASLTETADPLRA